MTMRRLAPGQFVVADLDGQERRVLADKVDEETLAVEVFYPPVDPSVSLEDAPPMIERTIVEPNDYRPDDPYTWPTFA